MMRLVLGCIATLVVVVISAVILSGGGVGIFLLIDLPTIIGIFAICAIATLVHTREVNLLGVPAKLLRAKDVASTEIQKSISLYKFLDKLVIGVAILFVVLGLILAVANFHDIESLIFSVGVGLVPIFYGILISVAFVRPSLYILNLNAEGA
ncbi:MAG: hypothetical protein FWG65_02375 [Turicibacter sp.]|nr:hypothetical protein [Turicibacter sp.]